MWNEWETAIVYRYRRRYRNPKSKEGKIKDKDDWIGELFIVTWKSMSFVFVVSLIANFVASWVGKRYGRETESTKLATQLATKCGELGVHSWSLNTEVAALAAYFNAKEFQSNQ